jgi:hypothetical protein
MRPAANQKAKGKYQKAKVNSAGCAAFIKKIEYQFFDFCPLPFAL